MTKTALITGITGQDGAYLAAMSHVAVSFKPPEYTASVDGIGDNYHPDNSHVIPALICKFHEAKQAKAPTVDVLSIGSLRREFMYSEDMADACITLAAQSQHCLAFIKRNLRHVQGKRGFNSPGRLLNHLDNEQIRFGLSNQRNPALAPHAFHILPYRGLGSGIPRAIESWPQLEFTDDRRGNQFRVTIRRNEVHPGGPNGGVDGGVNASSETLLQYIAAHPGQRSQAFAEGLETPLRTMERWLKQLREAGAIEFVGPPRTGGYHARVDPGGTVLT